MLSERSRVLILLNVLMAPLGESQQDCVCPDGSAPTSDADPSCPGGPPTGHCWYRQVMTGTCSANGYHIITDQSQCRAAADSLGLSYRDTDPQAKPESEGFPAGCTYHIFGNLENYLHITDESVEAGNGRSLLCADDSPPEPQPELQVEPELELVLQQLVRGEYDSPHARAVNTNTLSTIISYSIDHGLQFVAVTSGTCLENGYNVIMDQNVCETAASSLHLGDTDAQALVDASGFLAGCSFAPMIADENVGAAGNRVLLCSTPYEPSPDAQLMVDLVSAAPDPSDWDCLCKESYGDGTARLDRSPIMPSAQWVLNNYDYVGRERNEAESQPWYDEDFKRPHHFCGKGCSSECNDGCTDCEKDGQPEGAECPPDSGESTEVVMWVADSCDGNRHNNGWPTSWSTTTDPCGEGFDRLDAGWVGVQCTQHANLADRRIVIIAPFVDASFVPCRARGDITSWSQLTGALGIFLENCYKLRGDVTGWSALTSLQVVNLGFTEGLRGDVTGWSAMNSAQVIHLQAIMSLTGDISNWGMVHLTHRSTDANGKTTGGLNLINTKLCGDCSAWCTADICAVSVCCPAGQYGTFTHCILCEFPDRCLEGGGCIEGTTGVGCDTCQTKTSPPYAESGGDCVQCPAAGTLPYIEALVAFGIATASIWYLSLPHEETGRIANNMTSLLAHLQVFTLSIRVNAHIPQSFKQLWSLIGSISMLDFNDIATPICYTGDFNSDDSDGTEVVHKTWYTMLKWKWILLALCLVIPVVGISLLRLAQLGMRRAKDKKRDTAAESTEEATVPAEIGHKQQNGEDTEQAAGEGVKNRPPSTLANARLVVFGAIYSTAILTVLSAYACRQDHFDEWVTAGAPEYPSAQHEFYTALNVLEKSSDPFTGPRCAGTTDKAQACPTFAGWDKKDQRYECMRGCTIVPPPGYNPPPSLQFSAPPCTWRYGDLYDGSIYTNGIQSRTFVVLGVATDDENYKLDDLFKWFVYGKLDTHNLPPWAYWSHAPLIVLTVSPVVIFALVVYDHRIGQTRVGHTWIARYRDGAYWFEAVQFGSKYATAYVVVMLTEFPSTQLGMLALLGFGRLALHTKCLPLADPKNLGGGREWTQPNRVEAVGVTCQVASTALLLLSLVSGAEGRSEVVDFMLGALLLLCGVGPVLYAGGTHFKDHKNHADGGSDGDGSKKTQTKNPMFDDNHDSE